MENRKNIEVISGDGSNLDISPVYDHISSATPKFTKSKPTNIVIPTSKSNKTLSKKKKNVDKKDCGKNEASSSNNEEKKDI